MSTNDSSRLSETSDSRIPEYAFRWDQKYVRNRATLVVMAKGRDIVPFDAGPPIKPVTTIFSDQTADVYTPYSLVDPETDEELPLSTFTKMEYLGIVKATDRAWDKPHPSDD